MKKLNKIITIISVLMIFPLFFWYFNSVWFISPIKKNNLSKKQIDEICDKLKFDLDQNETLSIEYFPGVMQATTFLTVNINNIKSEDNFLSHFKGNIKNKVDISNLSEDKSIISKYDVGIFVLDHIPKDYSCSLSIIEKDKNLTAKIHISGYISQLENIYKVLNDPLQPLFDNFYFMTFAIVEIFLIIYLIFQGVFSIIRRRKKNSLARQSTSFL